MTVNNDSTPDLVFTRGDDVTRAWTWTDSDGDAIDLTGRTYAMQVRTNPDATSYWAFTASTTSAASGRITFTLARADNDVPPGRHYWDIEETISGHTTTPLSGRVTVRPDVTR